MKMKDLLSEEQAKTLRENSTENGPICLVCEVHDKANQLPESIRCPHCNYINQEEDEIVALEFDVIGETNGYDPEHNIGKYPMIQCNSCSDYYALMPQPVIYNANHDIYYTGGKEYLADVDAEKIFSDAEKQITQRIKEWIGKPNTPENLAYLITNEIKSSIASYLYERGLKK